MDLSALAKLAKKAAIELSAVETATKNTALAAVAAALKENSEAIIKANQADIEKAKAENLSSALLKRLKFDESKIDGVCSGIESLIKLDDPVGKTLAATELDKNLELYKVSCPIGVIGVIFESRPDALVQISTLCLKSGNAVLLKGGSEAANTNKILFEIISKATTGTAMPSGWIGLLQSREDVSGILELDEYIDLIIPRGSNEFVRYIMDNTNIAVMGHADGICHVYVDKDADVDMAVDITVDSKCQYCAVCNAAETLLVHADIAGKFLPPVKKALDAKGVEIRGCEKTRKIIDVARADEADWKTEYLELILSVKVVGDIVEAVDFINTYSSGHTDAIVTQDKSAAKQFLSLVNSADVFLNASTRFADGFRYGLGAEVGISTNKIHARGPVGLEGLMIYKWLLLGNGQTVADYSGSGKNFTHERLEKDFKI